MKVLITATSLRAAYGGPAFSVSQLATALGARGLEIGVWAADGSAPAAELLPCGAQVRRMEGPLRDAVAAFGPAAIHDNGLWLPHNHRVAELARETGLPRVVSTRGMLEPWAIRHKGLKKKVAWGLYQRRDLARASALHTTADAEAANLQALRLGPPVITIANGVDLPPAAPPGSRPQGGARTALFLGRLYPVKGLPMLVEAWARARPRDWRLVIAGPDEAGHRAVVEAVVAAAGLGEAVSFTGPVAGEAKTALLRGADVLVLPSHSESFGMVVAEALAHGTPVLTTTAVPWPALEARQCGWRAAPTADALAEALARGHSAANRRPCRRWAPGAAPTFPRRSAGTGVAAAFGALYERLVRGLAAAA